MNRRETLAAFVIVCIGVPLIFFFARAMADGAHRAEQGPIQAVLGQETYNQLLAGEITPLHYLGNNRLAPDFSLPDKDGTPWTLSEHRGELIVLNFWSVTCAPCLQEMPSLERMARIAEEDWGDVRVVAVSTDPGWEDVRSVLRESTPLTVLFDPDSEIVQGEYGSRLFPETWIIDRYGVIRFRFDGPLNWDDPVVLDVIGSFR